jgi:hypothetical protein
LRALALKDGERERRETSERFAERDERKDARLEDARRKHKLSKIGFLTGKTILNYDKA